MGKQYIIKLPIPKEELGQHKDYIGWLFENENDVYNICKTEEDIIKSNYWFNNLPIRCVVIQSGEIKPGDKIIPNCINKDLNKKIFTFIGYGKDDTDLIDLIDENNKTVFSTIHLLDDADLYLREITDEEKVNIVNGLIQIIN